MTPRTGRWQLGGYADLGTSVSELILSVGGKSETVMEAIDHLK